uniref:Uncharacterized protein n=1 Tax=Zea mays TaxID=4577 RepID=A0A804QM40_MAIZE
MFLFLQEQPHISPATNSEAQGATTSRKVTVSSVLEVAAASRPSSAPLLPTPRSTAPVASHIQTSTLLSRSMSEAAGRSLAYQSYSLGQDTAPSQPLSAYASSTTVMMPPAGRSDQSSARHGFKPGSGKLEAHDSWQQWKGDNNVDCRLTEHKSELE